jgi:hypothetical protein
VIVALRLDVVRGDDGRLSGTVSTKDDAEVHSFSGTLELMRVFEELVPTQPGAADTDRSSAA